MKILVSAIACSPYQGSENYVGWSALMALAREHELWVLTGRRGEAEMQRAAAEGLVPANLHFVFAGECQPWHPNRMRARLQSWQEYLQFSRAILPLARSLHAAEKFDVVHHVTYVTWRVGSPLWQLGVPFVFGPIGGNEHFPLPLLPLLSPVAGAFELARMASNVVSRLSPRVRRSLRAAAHVFVANAETEQLVTALRGSGAGISRLMATFHSADKAAGFSRFAADKPVTGPLRLFAAGNMEGRKGVALALEALALAKESGVAFQYRLGAHGPEIAYLKKLTARLGLESEVLFGDSLRGEDYQRELGATHVYLLPSLRDNAPVTLTEAMLAGCVPVVADSGGPGIMVNDACGYLIPVHHRRQMVAELTDVIITIDRDRSIIREKGQAASQRITAEFSEENYRRQINVVYQSVLTKKP